MNGFTWQPAFLYRPTMTFPILSPEKLCSVNTNSAIDTNYFFLYPAANIPFNLNYKCNWGTSFSLKGANTHKQTIQIYCKNLETGGQTIK